jgi:hypothetical protein
MPATDTQLKANSRGMTRLLVAIHEGDRARLAEASRVSGASQQCIIRNGLCLILDSILNDPRAKQAAGNHRLSPAPDRPARHTIDTVLDAIRRDQEEHGAVIRMTSTGMEQVAITFADGRKNRYATPDRAPGRAEREVIATNQALRTAFPDATTKLFRMGGAK